MHDASPALWQNLPIHIYIDVDTYNIHKVYICDSITRQHQVHGEIHKTVEVRLDLLLLHSCLATEISLSIMHAI